MPASLQSQIEFGTEITSDLRRIVAELYELREDAEAAGLHRAQFRIDRAISLLDSTASGLATQAGKMKTRLRRLSDSSRS